MKNESVSSQPMSWSGVFEMLSRVARSAGEVEPDSVADPRVVVLAGAVSSALLAMAQYVNGDESTLVEGALNAQAEAEKAAATWRTKLAAEISANEELRQCLDAENKAIEVWNRLSALVGCMSPDGSAELQQVEVLSQRAAEAEKAHDLRGQLDAAKRALAEVQADLCIERRQHAQQVTYLQTENTRLVLAMREGLRTGEPLANEGR